MMACGLYSPLRPTECFVTLACAGLFLLTIQGIPSVGVGAEDEARDVVPTTASKDNSDDLSAKKIPRSKEDPHMTHPEKRSQATFGSGCFWCTEAIFQHVRGVDSVVSGYAGGTVENPSYQSVSTGKTGHAEAVQVTYDPNVISYGELLEIFWQTHDPTTPNRQGDDVGPQYRSIIFHHDETQRQLAEQYKKQLDAANIFDQPVVTEIRPYQTLYPAEEYHQDYFQLNGRQPYCNLIIRPKVEKFKKAFSQKLKDP